MASQSTGSSFSEMDTQPSFTPEVSSNKRKGLHRNNNDEMDNSMTLVNPKRSKMDPSMMATPSEAKEFEEELETEQRDLTGPAVDDDDMEDESGLMIDEKIFHLSSSPSQDDVHRNNGSIEEKEEENSVLLESDHSNNSDKFYSQIKAMEEEKGIGKDVLRNTTVPSSSELKDFTTTVESIHNTARNNVSSLLHSNSNSTVDELKPTQVVHVYVKIINPTTNQVVLETKNFKSDLGTMLSFLKDHEVDVSHTESAYAADVSSEVVSSLSTGAEESFVESRLVAKSSIGSSIPRPSDASTINRPSFPLQVSMPKPRTPRIRDGHGGGMVRANRNAPLLSSTRISYGEENEMEDRSSETGNDKTTWTTHEARPEDSAQKKEANINENLSYSSSSMSNSASTTTSSITVKLEPGTSRRRTKGDIERNGIATRKSVDEFNDPAFVKSATLWGSIAIGSVCFARWRDKTYYSGRIDKRGQNDTWSIHFEDDMSDVASETHILPIKILGVGTWTVYCPPDIFKPESAIIVGQRFRDDTQDDLEKTEYALISDEDGRMIVSNRKNLTLAENDAREMRKLWQVSVTTKAADLSVENIVTGKRDRCAKAEPTPSSQIRALVAILESRSSDITTVTKRSTSESSNISTPTTSRKNPRGTSKNTTNTKPHLVEEESHEEDSLPYISETEFPPTPELPRKLSVDSESGSVKDEEGEGSTIFEGMHFFLTASGGGEGSSSGSPFIPYDKEDLRKMIENGGGTVLDGVGHEGRRRKNVFLISDNFARTVKYIYALAAGIPCLSYNWITECIVNQRIIDYEPYELNAGFSIESLLVLPCQREKPLKGFQVFVTGASDELYKYWKPVLQAAGAIIPKRPNTKKGQSEQLVPSQTDVLVTDATCPLEVWNYAKENEIPVVKPEWLVQTIIAGKRVAFDGHEKYTVTELDAPSP